MKKVISLLLSTCLLCACTSKDDINRDVVVSFDSPISENTIWCAGFNLVWNDLKDTYNNGKDISFKDGKNILLDEVNASTFTKNNLSKESYYTKSGYKTPALKEEIKQGIKEKFNQESDVLEDIQFEKDSRDLCLYAMLYKKFQYLVPFDDIGQDTFKDKQYAFFGIKESTEEKRAQLYPMYYKDEDHFVIRMDTMENDSILICKGIEGKTFKEIYENSIKKHETYDGSYTFTEDDFFKMPKLNINMKKDFEELKNHPFDLKDGEYDISDALQTIRFTLDEKGGEVKSEAILGVNLAFAPFMEEEKKERYFFVDDTFTLFLMEQDKELPYLALHISDMENYKYE